MPTSTYAPTELRGAELAEHILELIEAEQARKQRLLDRLAARADEYDGYDEVQAVAAKTNVWRQSTWAMVFLDALPPGTTIEPVPDTVRKGFDKYAMYTSATIAAVSSGLSCGTAMCFAGHAAFLAGDRNLVALYDEASEDVLTGPKNVKRFLNKVPDAVYHSDTTDYVLTPEQDVVAISERARRLLGLTKHEANVLFDASNTLDDIRAYVDLMKQGRHLTTCRLKTGRFVPREQQ